jgi:hypothetical protein
VTEQTDATLLREIESAKVENVDRTHAEFTLYDHEGRRTALLAPDGATRKHVTGAVRSVLGHSAADPKNIYTFSLLSRNLAALSEWFEENGCLSGDGAGDLAALVAAVKSYGDAMRAEYGERLASGRLEFDDLPTYYEAGRKVVFGSGDTAVGGPVRSTGLRYTWTGACFLVVAVDVIANVNGQIARTVQECAIGAYEGLTPVADLPVRPLEEGSAEMAALVARGTTFAKLLGGAAYMSYTGTVVRPTWYSETSFRADGRVVVDPATFARIDSNQLAACKRALFDNNKIVDEDADELGEETETGGVAPDQLYMCIPWVFGFSFRAKTWGTMLVAGISEIRWAEGAYDRLVLDARTKKRVRALVEHSGGGFGDIVEGKGGGCIFMLHGHPGLGKTLLAETVAEHLQRPLYPISVGELGTNPDQLEKRLREILDLASVWNAVLLLDEADIFMEARDERDVLRNAMVGVFLRLLEYHQGVLFLTTNRVKNIDRAFLSRISVGIFFGPADTEKRAKIWTNLLEAAGVGLPASDVEGLAAEFDINGRQIKNVIRGAMTIARDEGVPVGVAQLREEAEETRRFEEEIRSLGAPSDVPGDINSRDGLAVAA